MSKTRNLLTALQSGSSITRAGALAAFKIANLSAIVSDLRRAGYKITAITEPDGSNDGSNYTRWVYKGHTRKTRGAMVHP